MRIRDPNLSSAALISVLLLTGGALAAGCVKAPEYSRPHNAALLPGGYDNASLPSAVGLDTGTQAPAGLEQPQTDATMSHWWKELEDAHLQEQIEALSADNLQLKEAEARIRQARAQIRISASALAPSLNATGTYNRSFRPAEDFSDVFGGGPPLPGSGGGAHRIYDTSLQPGLDASWQLDIFGGLSARVASSKAVFYAETLEREALLHTLVAELVRRRVNHLALEERLALAREVAENRSSLLTIIEKRYRLGAASTNAGDVFLARQALATVEEDIPDLQQALIENMYAVDILLGRKPGSSGAGGGQYLQSPPKTNTDVPPGPADSSTVIRGPVSTQSALGVPPPSAPPGLPVYLLDRRPDLQSAELRLIAQNYNITAAVGDLYPSFTLRGNLGFENEDLAHLFSAERLIGALAASLSAPIYRGGALRRRIEQEKAVMDEYVASYARAVLNAIQEVDTALMREKKLQTRLAIVKEKVTAAHGRLQSDARRFQRGVLPLRDYLDGQLDYYAARLDAISGREAIWNARINLYLALGGDWNVPVPQAEEGKDLKEPPSILSSRLSPLNEKQSPVSSDVKLASSQPGERMTKSRTLQRNDEQ